MSHAVKLSTNEQTFVLPADVIGRSDVNHLMREIEKVDYELEAQAVRQPGQALILPSLTHTMAGIMAANNLAVETPDHRKDLLTNLRTIKEHAPVMQITFAADPDPAVLAQLVGWVRQNLHPAALVTVGMQPSIVGGCVVRTPDHIYDFSLKKQFKQNISDLLAAINKVAAGSVQSS